MCSVGQGANALMPGFLQAHVLNPELLDKSLFATFKARNPNSGTWRVAPDLERLTFRQVDGACFFSFFRHSHSALAPTSHTHLPALAQGHSSESPDLQV